MAHRQIQSSNTHLGEMSLHRQPERRASKRFRVVYDFRYRVVGVEVFSRGKTVNMSTGGMLLAIDRVLSPGLLVEVEVDWPVKLAEQVSLKLVVEGQIVRSDKNDVALVGVKILRHTFHTASSQGVAGNH
jgi:hypothetical protein